MPQYKNANASASLRYENVATDYFKKGVETRETGDDYVRVTVFLATVLFLTALSQRFGDAGPRVIIVGIATMLLVISMFWIVTLPRT